MPWTPLLEGALRDRALEAADAIGRDLVRHPEAGVGPGLARGDTGLALAHAYLDRAFPGAGHAEEASARLERAAEHMVEGDVGLWEGSHGPAWVIAHLVSTEGEDDPCADFDRGTLRLVSQRPWDGQYELVHGLVGFGVYALERLPRPAAREILEEVVARLEELAEPSARGTTWLTRPGTVDESIARILPRGWYELGLAHGVAGVIVLLSAAARAGVARARAAELVDGAVRWLLALHDPAGRPARFPRLVEPGGAEPAPARRPAWCSGDPGIAVALVVAARTFARPDWLELGREAARTAAAIPLLEATIRDACLCHGAVGLAHIFNRLWQATGDDALREGALQWLTHALAMREDGAGVGGFRSRSEHVDDREAGVLMGGAGVALGLVAAATSEPPAWDRLLLLSSAG